MTIKNILKKIILLLISVLLFVAANPNYFVHNGLGFVAFFYFIPVFILIRYCSFKVVWLYGGIYGALSYGLYAYWLFTYDSICLVSACLIYFIFMAIVFLLLKTSDILFKKNGWLVQWLCLCTFEYVKTLGFIGFNYGVTAYTQWKNILFIQIAKIIGPFGVSALVIFPSAVISSLILKIKEQRKYDYEKHLESVKKIETNTISHQIEKEIIKNRFSTKSTFIIGSVWAVLFIFVMIYGLVQIRKDNSIGQMKVAAIQSNESPWKNGIEEITKDLQNLMQLTDEALEINPDIQIVVWPETAVVPAIVYNYKEKKDERRAMLINLLLEYINSKDAVFIIGNGHEINSNKPKHDKYNSALVFYPGENVIPPEPKIYSKVKLVPFSEYFPYGNYFPEFYRYLTKKNPHMWNQGKDYKVFKKDKLYFSTPICFEDTFPSTGRQMFQKGARCFFNLSNDSWANSIACQNQHLAMAVFRSVENQIPSVRSTTSGQTCIIDVNGKIISMCDPFTSSYVVGSIPVIPQYQEESFYTKNGDIFAIIVCFTFLFLLIIRTILVIIRLSSK